MASLEVGRGSQSGGTREASPDWLQAQLSRLNQGRMSPALPSERWRDELHAELELKVLEGEFVERERRAVEAEAARAPSDPDAFVAWFEALRETGPGQGDRLFPWLASEATAAQLKWFLTQEVAGEAGFEDLVAMTQLKMPVQAKLELARNFWDELGQGAEGGMHGPMLSRLAAEVGVANSEEPVVWEALALGNTLVAFAANRRYAYHSIGALGAIELTAPTRAVHVNAALKRLGVSPAGRRYFALHATLDVKHSEAWNREILRPIVAEDPRTAVALAEGALLRLRAGQRCFERYRREFGLA